MSRLRTPTATYRLQFNRHFRFGDACNLVPYLHKLGISDIYASPILKARRGSLHGYDVTDPSRLNPELGTEVDFANLSQALKNNEMGLLLDIVPNHMAASQQNPWWHDLQMKGEKSAYVGFFDTDWLAFDRADNLTTGHRRFFDIGDLVGIRIEDTGVFNAVHSLILKLINEGKVTGLRIDHIDGLYDPLEYLIRLQQNSTGPQNGSGPGFYVVVEKILAEQEILPQEWPVFGTTGYDYASLINTLFIDSHGSQALSDIYTRFLGYEVSFNDTVYEKKRLVIKQLFAAEIRALGQYLSQLAHQDRHTANLAEEPLTEALTELTVFLPVYRTYIRNLSVSDRDRVHIENILAQTKWQNPEINSNVIDFVQRVLLLDLPYHTDPEQCSSWLFFILRWQQLTGAIMAKGFEDTALYCYNKLISLNEVGGKPDSLGISTEEFHQRNIGRFRQSPHTLNTTSTHDTKRGEDVRSRLNVLSEIPEIWGQVLNRWSSWNQSQKTEVNGQLVPEPNTEILLYQTLIGAWPHDQKEIRQFKKRLKGYMIKAVREAKTFTSWIQPNQPYEAAVDQFIDRILKTTKLNRFLGDFLQFQGQIAFYGALNSLSQVLLKITSPGVPDFYQGSELWDLSLVDPDNRRMVNFGLRNTILNELMKQEVHLRTELLQQMIQSWQDGRIKLYVIYKALNMRRLYSDIFKYGNYISLESQGRGKEHVCAFARRQEENWILTIIPRFFTKLISLDDLPCGQEVWKRDKLQLPANAPVSWINIFTEEKVEVSDNEKGLLLSDIFSTFPIALLRNT